MVIQANMTPKAIVEVWEDTKEVFRKYMVPANSELTLAELAEESFLPELLRELNNAAGSSSVTCIEGG